MKIYNDADEFLKLTSEKFSSLQSLRVYKAIKQTSEIKQQVEVILASNSISQKYLKIQADNATDIIVSDISMADGIFVEIINIKDRQLEDAAFIITDSENRIFYFYCKSFTAEIISESELDEIMAD